jgi:putative tributyrin esterase
VAFFDGSIYAHTLKMNTSISVLLPDDTQARPKDGFHVLYLLHGLFDNRSAWVRNTTVTRYAEENGIALIMPEVQRSYYTDMRYGYNYFTYVSDELPRLCREMFGLSERREKTFVAGISMGGYGALKCGLRRPDVFSACAGLSAATDIKKRAADYKNRPDMCNAFGEPAVVSGDDDLFGLACKAGTLPDDKRAAVLMCCGTEDTRLEENRALKSALEQNGVDLTYCEEQGGHDWQYWARILPQMFDFFSTRLETGK